MGKKIAGRRPKKLLEALLKSNVPEKKFESCIEKF